jgi:hypothetical protein
MTQIYYSVRKTFHLEKSVKVMKQLENRFLTNNLIIRTEKTKAVLFQGRGTGLTHGPILYLRSKEST